MSSVVRDQRRRLFVAEISRVVPGLYGWFATVLFPVTQAGVRWPARGAAVLAALALASSYLLATTRPRQARWLGVYTFLFFCFMAWAALGARLRSDQVDAVRGALGALGFLLHALAWGAPPKNPDTDNIDNLVPGQPLQPRQQPVKSGVVVLAIGLAVSVAPLFAAFRVERPGASLLAQAMALACGIAVVGASADIALRVGKAGARSGWRGRTSRAVWPLGALTLMLGIGLVWLGLR